MFHIGYIKQVTTILQCICKTCSAVLLPPEQRAAALSRLRRYQNDRLERQAVFKSLVVANCKKIRVCWRCDGLNGPVKKITSAFRLVHEPFRHKSTEDAKDNFLDEFEEAKLANAELETHLNKAVHDLTPLIVLQVGICCDGDGDGDEIDHILKACVFVVIVWIIVT